MTTFTLAHLSDLHLSAPALTGKVLRSPKRMLAYLSWRTRKRGRHDLDILAAAAADVRALDPDAIVITGDLTHLGLPSEFDQVREWLPSLGPSERVRLVPGNHDRTASEADGATLERWRAWVAPEQDASASIVFPTVRIAGGVALVGLSSARPSSPLLAVGSLGQEQIHRLDAILDDMSRSQCFRVVFLHHPPGSDVVGWRKRLTDADALQAVLERRGAEMILHGHAHRPTWDSMDLQDRTIPVVGASSVSEVRHGGAAYHTYGITPAEHGYEIVAEVRTWRPEARRFESEPRGRFLISDDQPSVFPGPVGTKRWNH